jgi:hypothetical protein
MIRRMTSRRKNSLWARLRRAFSLLLIMGSVVAWLRRLRDEQDVNTQSKSADDAVEPLHEALL